MRRTAKIVTAAVVGILSLVSAMSCPAAIIKLNYEPGAPLVPAPRISQPPTIDGKLDDPCWAKAAQTSNFVSYSGSGLAKARTELSMAFDREKLYLAFKCQEPQPEKMVTTVKDRDGMVWQNDSVELFFDTGRDRSDYFQFIVSAQGVQFDSEVGPGRLGPAWNATWEAKTTRNDNSWTCEIAIPFSELKSGSPKAGTVWGFNAARNRPAVSENSNWAGLLGKSDQPKLFGDLVFTELPMGIISKSIGSMFYGSNPLKLEVYNLTSYSQVVTLRAEVGSSDDQKWRTSQRMVLTRGERKPVELNYEVRDGDYLVVTLLNDETGEVFQRERYRLPLPSPRISEIRGWIADADNAVKLAGDHNAKLTQQLKLLSAGLRQKLNEFQGTVDVKVKARTPLEQEQWEKFRTEFESYSERVRSLGNILWTRNPWIAVMPDDLPDSTSNLEEISLSIGVQEFESACFQLTNLLGKRFDGRLVLSDLIDNISKGSGIKQIGKDHIAVRNVLYRTQKDGKIIPDALPLANQANQVTVDPGATTQVWLTFDSRDAVPGNYAGTITVKPFDRAFPVKLIKLNLTVLPIKLPDKMPISTYNWDYAPNEAYVRDMAEHRVNTFLLSAPLPELDENANLVKSGDYNSAQLQLKRDFGQLMYSYGIIESYDNYVKGKFGWQFMDEKWKKGFKAWITDWTGKLNDIGVGYGDFSMQLWDEPRGEEVDKVVQAGTFLREIDPNIRTVMDPYLSFTEPSTTLADMQKMASVIDIWIPVLKHLQPGVCPDAAKELEFLKSTGKPVWIYTCDTPMPELSPTGYYRLKPWHTWNLGLSGCAFWAYNSWRGDSWDDTDSSPNDPYSDNGVVYSGDNGPITSRRWEAYREGLEDYLYLHLLNAAIEKGKKLRIDMNSLLAAKDTLDKVVPEVLAGAEKDPAVVDSARTRIMQQILALNRLMAFTAKTPVSETHDADIIIRWETSEAAVGTVYVRRQGSQSWRAVTDLVPSTSHSITLNGTRPGVVYEYYTESVNDVGLMQVDDNNSAYYTCSR